MVGLSPCGDRATLAARAARPLRSRCPAYRQVMERTKTDMAFCWFLGLGLHDEIRNHSDGSHFRQRIGAKGFQWVFQELVTPAREHGLVSDRLRLEDATPTFADVAKVGQLSLVARVRERLWQAAEPPFAEWVSQQQTLCATRWLSAWSSRVRARTFAWCLPPVRRPADAPHWVRLPPVQLRLPGPVVLDWALP